MKYALLLALAACGGEQKPAPVANQASGSALEEQRAVDEHRRDIEERHVRARAAKAKLDQAQADLAEVDAKVANAVETVAAAQNDADRSAAMARFHQLRDEQDAAKKRFEQAKAENDEAQRALPTDSMGFKCLENPLLEGCT